MRPDLQRDSTARHSAEDLLQCLRTGTDLLLQLYLARFIHYAKPTVAISQIQPDRELLLRKILLGCAAAVLTFFIAGLLFICASSTSITWERTPHPVGRPAFSSHMVTTVIASEDDPAYNSGCVKGTCGECPEHSVN
jgi:hypothetical protein